MNPFTHSTAAQRYAKARPYFHPAVIARVREFLPVDWPVQRVLDVACGTGQSCIALKELAREIVGTDISNAMLAEAPADQVIRYVKAPAEELPFADESFDLITVSLAFHWLDRTRFLAEASRLLPSGKWLVVYNNHFSGMKANPDFKVWMGEMYAKKYPSVPKYSSPLTEEEAKTAGFSFVRNESYSNDVLFDLDELVRYLTTHSNIIAAVESGRERIDDVLTWLRSSIEPMFRQHTETFEFFGPIWYLQKN